MNTYKLPVDAYNRTHEQTTSEDAINAINAIKDKLVGQKTKRKEIIDVIVDKDKMVEEEDFEPQESEVSDADSN